MRENGQKLAISPLAKLFCCQKDANPRTCLHTSLGIDIDSVPIVLSSYAHEIDCIVYREWV